MKAVGFVVRAALLLAAPVQILSISLEVAGANPVAVIYRPIARKQDAIGLKEYEIARLVDTHQTLRNEELFIAKRISEPLGHHRLQFHTTSGSLFLKSRHQPIVKNPCNCTVPLGEL